MRKNNILNYNIIVTNVVIIFIILLFFSFFQNKSNSLIIVHLFLKIRFDRLQKIEFLKRLGDGGYQDYDIYLL